MSTEKVLVGVVAGLAAGAILGILFAPDKGTETRRKIAQKGTDLTNNIKTKFSSMVDGVVDEYETVKGKAGDLMEEGKEKMTSFKADAKHAVS
jgi:gas vesicle protein